MREGRTATLGRGQGRGRGGRDRGARRRRARVHGDIDVVDVQLLEHPRAFGVHRLGDDRGVVDLDLAVRGSVAFVALVALVMGGGLGLGAHVDAGLGLGEGRGLARGARGDGVFVVLVVVLVVTLVVAAPLDVRGRAGADADRRLALHRGWRGRALVDAGLGARAVLGRSGLAGAVGLARGHALRAGAGGLRAQLVGERVRRRADLGGRLRYLVVVVAVGIDGNVGRVARLGLSGRAGLGGIAGRGGLARGRRRVAATERLQGLLAGLRDLWRGLVAADQPRETPQVTDDLRVIGSEPERVQVGAERAHQVLHLGLDQRGGLARDRDLARQVLGQREQLCLHLERVLPAAGHARQP